MSIEDMLEPIKLCKTPKGQCQKEPWDLSIHHSDVSTDVSGDLIAGKYIDTDQDVSVSGAITSYQEYIYLVTDQ